MGDTDTRSGPDVWHGGDLRRTTLEVNGFPEGHDEADVPDELFLATPSGRVQVTRELGDVHPTRYEWCVSVDPHDPDGETFEDFEDAFAHALLLVRREVEQ